MGKIRKIFIKIISVIARMNLSTILISVVLFLSFFTRFYNLNKPQDLIFDENYFIPMANKYIKGEFFADPHPPLGKLLITAGACLYPGTPIDTFIESSSYDYPKATIIRYRIVPAFFASLVPVIVFFLTKYFTHSNTLSFLASFMITLDNAIITHSRFALFDEILILFILTSLLFILYFIRYVKKKNIFTLKNIVIRFGLLTIASFFAGAAVSTKVIGVSAILFIYIGIIYKTYKDELNLKVRSQILILCEILIPFIIIASVFLGSFYIHFSLLNSPGDNFNEFSPDFQKCILKEDDCNMFLIEMSMEAMRWSSNYEKLVPELDFCKDDEIGSSPTQWPFMSRAIAFYFTNHNGLPLSEVSYIYLSGNPVVWFTGFTGILFSLSLITSSIFILKPLLVDKKLMFLTVLYLTNYIPYFLIKRVMYFYHYFPALIFSVIIFVVVLNKFYCLHIKHKIRKIFPILFTTIFLLIILLSFLIYSPLTYNEVIDVNYIKKINIVKFWNIQVDPYNYESDL